MLPIDIDNYLDALLANQTARKALPPISQKVAIVIARWQTARVIISLTCLTNHSKADRWRQPMMCCLLYVEQLNAVCKTCGHHAIITTAVVSSLFTGSAPVCTATVSDVMQTSGVPKHCFGALHSVSNSQSIKGTVQWDSQINFWLCDLHMAQLMPLPFTVSCFSKMQIGTFLVWAHPGSPGKRAVKRVCVMFKASSFLHLSLDTWQLVHCSLYALWCKYHKGFEGLLQYTVTSNSNYTCTFTENKIYCEFAQSAECTGKY